MNSNDSLAIDGLIARLSKSGINLSSLPTAIYARKSTKDETQISLPLQIEYCNKYIEGDSRLNLIKTYSEDKISGYKIETRKQFTALLEEVRKGNIRVIVYYSLDRESRNNTEGSALDLELERLGVLQIYVTQSFQNDAHGRFLKTIVRADAQRQVEYNSERVLPALKKIALQSKTTGGTCLYGYKVIEEGRITINEDEAPAVKLMFELAQSGSTLSDISLTLAKKGYFNRSNKPFPVNTIWNMLRNEKYKGEYIYFKKGARKNKKRVSKIEMDEIRIKGGIPQIISEQTFNKVQEVLKIKSNSTTTKSQECYILGGYLFCGESGRKMHGESSYGGTSRLKYCRYTTPRNDDVICSISKEVIELATAEIIASLLNKIQNEYFDISQMKKSLKGHLQTELVQLQNKIPSVKKELMSSVKALSKLNDKETINIVNDEITELREVLTNMINRKNVLLKSISSFEKYFKEFANGNAVITASDIQANSTLFKCSLSIFVKDIKIFKDEIVFNLNDLTK